MLALWEDWVMDRMKGRRDPKLRFPWDKPWVLAPVLVNLGLHLHQQVELVEMTSSQVSAASNTNSEASRNNNIFFFHLSYFNLIFPYIHFLIRSLEQIGMLLCCQYMHLYNMEIWKLSCFAWFPMKRLHLFPFSFEQICDLMCDQNFIMKPQKLKCINSVLYWNQMDLQVGRWWSIHEGLFQVSE